MRIAFIGLGAMGGPMARNLAGAAGVELVACDVSAERLAALSEVDGVRAAASVGDAVAGADAVFTVLPADQHVLTVAEEVAAARAGNHWFVDFSTIGPTTIDTVAGRLAAVGTETVSVTLTRSTAAAQNADLGLFVGGPPELPAPLRAGFDAMASDVFLVGSHGAAKTFKIVNNMVVAVLDTLICEAIVLGGLAGATPQQVTDALADRAPSWVLGNHIVRYVLPDDLGPGRFSTRYMAKDVGLCAQFARQQGIPAFFCGLALAGYRGAVAHGYGDDYHMKVIRWLESAAAAPRRVGTGDPLPTLAAGVAAVQALVSYEALELAAAAGMPPTEAAGHFENGSAGNSGLDWARGSGTPPNPTELVAALEPVLELAHRVDAPATLFETARHRALAIGQSKEPLW